MANSASHPSGVGKMSSHPLMMSYEGGHLTADWRYLWPVVGPLRGVYVCRLWATGGLSSLAALISDESALEVCAR